MKKYVARDVEDRTEPIDYGQWEEHVAHGRIPGPTTLDEYFSYPPAELHREELLYGWRVREALPVPRHQFAVANLIILIGMHLMETGLGLVAPSSDIALDENARLVLGPDAIVVLNDRMHIVGEKRLHGPPDLVIEALSPSTSRRDRIHKSQWYREYGVDELWLVDTRQQYVEVVDFTSAIEPAVARFVEADEIRSQVLPDLKITAEMAFAPLYQAAIQRIGLVKPGESSTSYARPKRKRTYDTDPT